MEGQIQKKSLKARNGKLRGRKILFGIGQIKQRP